MRRGNTDYQCPFEQRGNYPRSAQQRLQPPLDQLPWWPLPQVLWEGSPDTTQDLQAPSPPGVIRSGLPHALHHCSNASVSCAVQPALCSSALPPIQRFSSFCCPHSHPPSFLLFLLLLTQNVLYPTCLILSPLPRFSSSLSSLRDNQDLQGGPHCLPANLTHTVFCIFPPPLPFPTSQPLSG